MNRLMPAGRRCAKVGRLVVDAGLIELTVFISSVRAERGLARRMIAAGEFVEVHGDARSPRNA